MFRPFDVWSWCCCSPWRGTGWRGRRCRPGHRPHRPLPQRKILSRSCPLRQVPTRRARLRSVGRHQSHSRPHSPSNSRSRSHFPCHWQRYYPLPRTNLRSPSYRSCPAARGSHSARGLFFWFFLGVRFGAGGWRGLRSGGCRQGVVRSVPFRSRIRC